MSLNNADAQSFLLFKIPQINSITGVTYNNMLVLPFVVECETPDYTWSGNKSSDWMDAANWSCNAVPTATDDVTIPGSVIYGATLTASATVKSITLQGFNKLTLGNHNLTVNSITGNENGYVVTNGTGGLTIKNVSTVAATFPVGPSTTAYTPVIIKNNIARDFTVRVGTTLTNAAALTKTVNLQWEVTPSVLTGNVATLAFGWNTPNHGTAFNPNAAIEVAHYNTTLAAWDRFYLATLTGPNPYVATVTDVNTFSPFVVANQNALSVELLDFKGTPQYNGNFLTWTTANEVNNKGFYVETRFIASNAAQSNANNEWKTLGFVKSKGKEAAYDFTDAQDAINRVSTSYYRLRQMDNDGKEALSKVVSVSRNASTKLKVYPNPVSNVLTVEVERNDIPFYILNLLGQQVLSGKTVQRIDVSALPQGAYFLKVGTEQVKFIKQ